MLGTKTKEINTPEVKLKAKAKKASEIEINDLKVMIYGPTNVGKTRTISELLEQGYKVLYFSTDIGGNGLLSVFNALRKADKKDLLENLIVYESKHLQTYDQVIKFLERPENYVEGFYDIGIDIIFWDGYSNFQADFIHRKVVDNIEDKASSSDKDLSAAREAGMQFEIADYGQIKLATIKSINKFFAINNKKTGQIIHKIMTCHPVYASKAVKGENGAPTSIMAEVRKPQVTGQAGMSVFGAFDLIAYAGYKRDPLGKSKGVYYFQTESDELTFTKNRGFDLDPQEKSFGDIWAKLVDQSGIGKKSFDQSLIDPELLDKTE